MICVSETYSNRFNSTTPIRVTMREVSERGPEWERRYDKDVFHHYFATKTEASQAMLEMGVSAW